MKPEKITRYLKNAKILNAIPVSKALKKWVLYEYPFDAQLLSLSPLYLKSRKLYLKLGGAYQPRICSTMRALSAQDLFEDVIDYTPSLSQINWFCQRLVDVYDPAQELDALERYNEISIFHEQNHRVIWRLLPPAPKERRDLHRYLNFAESLVVLLDLALGDQLGKKYSPVFEQMKVIYRSGGGARRFTSSNKLNRDYYLALFVATYLLLELANPEDINGAVDYIFPGQKALNRSAVKRSFELSELFTRVTNPKWQVRFGGTLKKNYLKCMLVLNKPSSIYLRTL